MENAQYLSLFVDDDQGGNPTLLHQVKSLGGQRRLTNRMRGGRHEIPRRQRGQPLGRDKMTSQVPVCDDAGQDAGIVGNACHAETFRRNRLDDFGQRTRGEGGGAGRARCLLWCASAR